MKLKKILAVLSCITLFTAAFSCSSGDNKEEKSSSESVSDESSEASETEPETESESGSEQSSSADVSVSFKLNSSWESGGTTTYDYTVTLKNNSDKPVDGWTVVIPTDNSVGSSWGCSCNASDGSITVTPENYNSVINAGESV